MASVDNNIPKILIVDDVDTNRQILKNIIQEMNCQPILAENGIQALKFLERIVPQLIVTDIAMPQMDGYELCENIKKNPGLREIPVIFISAFDNPQDLVKGYEMGCEDYIVKPFIPEVVKARVGVQLKLSESSKNLQEANKRLKTSIDEQLNQIDKERKNVLYALLRVIKSSVYYNEEYIQKISKNCQIFAEAMQLSASFGDKISDNFIDSIGLLVPLCDLGYISVPESIYHKANRLNEEESKVRETHTTVGAEILKDIRSVVNANGYLDMAIDMSENHHEHWDGSGFPMGKKANDIPLAAQIYSVVGGYTDRCAGKNYGDPLSPEEAVEQMKKEAGTCYNPELIDILSKIYKQLV